jgi:hypothetical protein
MAGEHTSTSSSAPSWASRFAAWCPAWLRHAGILYSSTAAGVVLKAIIVAGGVTGVPWADTLLNALDTGAVATAAGLLLLVGTPATRQYGVGSSSSSTEPSGAGR